MDESSYHQFRNRPIRRCLGARADESCPLRGEFQISVIIKTIYWETTEWSDKQDSQCRDKVVWRLLQVSQRARAFMYLEKS